MKCAYYDKGKYQCGHQGTVDVEWRMPITPDISRLVVHRVCDHHARKMEKDLGAIRCTLPKATS